MTDLFKKTALWMKPRAARAAALAALAAVSAALVVEAPVSLSPTALSSVLPPSLPSFQPCFSPPYLFFAVHLIIMLIWKLSGTGKKDRADDKPEEAKPPVSLAPAAASPIPQPERSSDEESCVTMDDDAEDGPVSGENDSMDATWEAIMRGGASPVRQYLAESGVERAVPEAGGGVALAAVPAVGPPPDEMNLRFEEFIKKNYEQMRAGVAPAVRRDQNRRFG